MTGTLWAILAGIGYGVFQALHRRAGRELDIYRGMFVLLLIGSLVLAIIAMLGEDVTLLRTAPLGALLSFALAGVIHFFAGWSLLTLSQERIGAARTGALVAATPLFAALIAFLALDEVPQKPALVGILLVVVGVYIITGA